MRSHCYAVRLLGIMLIWWSMVLNIHATADFKSTFRHGVHLIRITIYSKLSIIYVLFKVSACCNGFMIFTSQTQYQTWMPKHYLEAVYSNWLLHFLYNIFVIMKIFFIENMNSLNFLSVLCYAKKYILSIALIFWDLLELSSKQRRLQIIFYLSF